MKPRRLLLTIPFLFSSLLFSQVVCGGSTEQCAQRQKELCAAEAAPSNLRLDTNGEVSGVVRDQSGTFFAGGVAVQLRNGMTGAVLRATEVEKHGRFNLGSVDSGTSRLIVVKIEAGNLSRLIPFDQPSELKCVGERSCDLVVVPTVHGTDNKIDASPPR